jgi:RNA polymerase sigma-70 factor (ECF subfamily)
MERAMCEPGHAVADERAMRKSSGWAGRRVGSSPPRTDCPPAIEGGPSDDRALVARVLAGDAAAFATLVDRHHASFLRLARACGQGAAAVRVVNDCWTEILGALATFRFDRSLRAWMLAVVAGCATQTGDELSAWRQGPVEGGAARDREVEQFDEHGRWVDAPARWNERRSGVELATAVEDAIAQLPSAERAVLTLRDVERLGGDDTCAILGLAAATERALLAAARCRVRRIVDQRFRASAEWQTTTGDS